jgi:hypothetical protein
MPLLQLSLSRLDLLKRRLKRKGYKLKLRQRSKKNLMPFKLLKMKKKQLVKRSSKPRKRLKLKDLRS